MSIWEYSSLETAREVIQAGLATPTCPFCQTPLDSLPLRLDRNRTDARIVIDQYEKISVDACSTCGWWRAASERLTNHWRESGRVGADGKRWLSSEQTRRGMIARLRVFSAQDIDVPLEDVRSFLVANDELRFEIHPRIFEEVVADVFRDLGFHARVTAYSGDGGIDVVLDGPDESMIGVQVKRYKNTISVEPIRALTGALFNRGYTAGIFVTTSDYQKGAHSEATMSTLRGIPVVLINGTRFLEALGIAQRKKYVDKEEVLDQIDVNRLIVLEYESTKLPPYI